MVYESDFYTTRRPVSSYRPSSYSTTAELIYRPTTRTVTRLTTYPEPPQHMVRVRVRPSIVLRELDRIQYRKRPQLSISAVDDFCRSESTKTFQDESRRIRADTASLLQRARSVVPRGSSLCPLDTIFSYSHGEPVSYRFSSDPYAAKVLVPSVWRNVANNIHNISFYNEPAKKFTGRGHLAAVHYSGKKAFSNRVPFYKHLSVRDDVNLLSFYAKNRLAANGLANEHATVKLLPWRPTRKFQPVKIMEDPSEELKASKAEREARFRASTLEPDFAPAAAQVDLAAIKKKRQEEARAAEEKALKEEAKRDAERKAQAEKEAAEKRKAEEEAKRKAADEASKAEEEAKKAEQARLAEEANKAEKAKKAEEAKIAAEAAARAEEDKLAAEAKKAELAAKKAEEEAKKAEEEAKKAEEARLAEEAKLAEEERQAEQRRQEELAKLQELEKQAQEEHEDELARQAAELAEIARQESELAAARLEELSRSGSAADNLDTDASETPAATEEPEPVVEEPESPTEAPVEPSEVVSEAPAAEADPVEVSEDEQAEPDITDEE